MMCVAEKSPATKKRAQLVDSQPVVKRNCEGRTSHNYIIILQKPIIQMFILINNILFKGGRVA